jgi:hypothetical protein
MLELWRQSEKDPHRPSVGRITKSAFLALSEEQRGALLGDFLIIKDASISPEFLPQ